METKEYVVTLHNFEDLESFYEDMEAPGGNLFIPNRRVEIAHKRPTSRNTHYMLTTEEAEQLKRDNRVLDVELTLQEQGLEIRPLNYINRDYDQTLSPNYVQTSSAFDKSNTLNNSMRNWALLRVYEGLQRANWGINGTTAQSGTIQINSSGRNVDVVIVDGHFYPDHPEFAVNSDGTGGSRVNQFNWLSLTNAVNGGVNGTYVYTPYEDPSYADVDNDGIPDRTDDNDHGAHVAGTVAGNTQGWARDANIYNISPYGTAPSFVPSLNDYIRYWHQTKAINPATGRRNPTITNHSYGISGSVTISSITTIRFRGVIYNGPFSAAELDSYGVMNNGTSTAYYESRNTAWETDFAELIAAGVIVISSAGNSSSRIVLPSADPNDDYNNYFVSSGTTRYYMRGSISAGTGVICVGSIGEYTDEAKSYFSCVGPRIDIWAPGHFIMSAHNSTYGSAISDSRNASYRVTKKSGTSMASPQVAGVLACLAENWPRMNQSEALQWLIDNSKYGQIGSDSGGFGDPYDLQDSANRYLYFKQPRQATGNVYPAISQGNRPTTGMAFPRTKIYRYGS